MDKVTPLDPNATVRKILKKLLKQNKRGQLRFNHLSIEREFSDGILDNTITIDFSKDVLWTK